jgi:hypothetical protein
MSFNVTGLSAYTQENTDLIAEAILNTEVLKHLAVRTGVTAGTTTINLFSTDFADAARSCGWDATTEFAYDQLAVTVADRQIKQEVCVPDLREFWLSERMQPGAGTEEVPFAELVANYYLGGIKKNIEDFIGAELITASAGFAVQGGTPAALTVSNAIEQLNDLYDALDERAKMMEDVIIVMSPEKYRTAVRALVAAGTVGMYHYNFADGQGDIYLPGTNAKLVKNSGFAGEDTIVALPGKYAVFCTGLMDDMDKFNMFYDQGQDVVKMTAFYRRGLGVYSPAQCATNGL